MSEGNGAPKDVNPQIAESIERVKAAEEAQQIPLLTVPVLPQAQNWTEKARVTLKPKASQQPTLLIWIGEIGAYQAVFLPPGTEWKIEPGSAAAPPRILVPGQF